MKRDHSFLERVTQFVSGKGFYLVLLLCVAAIGVSGYFLMRSILNDGESQAETVVGHTQMPQITASATAPGVTLLDPEDKSGGIRDKDSLAAALASGCARVNLGTAALENPEWTAAAIAEHGDRIAVGLDVRGSTLAARGWTREGGDL